ncbi:hypothetical protein AUK40_03700 [Candidatus Wirthbacteria bacterium CG2_30_54_11]|uniref:NADH:quinone oxidoreductase/Mrp antiporter membrane subunit domain-containing protein n=1 Tax=Candidatus Wirthbacteria bacterium CG2_30_54_11 TaxID=1817892 RepID=A0A1J5IS20_9BACT|nr:MAG: hypothetical protein AUK40_03700 [Candidatus Wirthbacteria bacterium CG2_30_54_11]
MVSVDYFPFWFFILPLALACVLPFLSRVSRQAVTVLSVSVFTLLAVMSWYLTTEFGRGVSAITTLWGIELRVDALSSLLMLTISVIGAIVCLYATSYMDHLGGKTKFYSLFLIMCAGMYSLVMASDLFSLYVCLEAAAVASYVLIAFSLKWDGIEAAFKYMILSAISTTMIVFASAVLFYLYGTLSFSGLSVALAGRGAQPTTLMLGGLLLCGFAFKAALVPFHAWLPDAHPSAPAPVSAMLSGVLIKVLGVYAIARVLFTVFHAPAQILSALTVLSAVSIVLGGLLGLKQTDFKRLLAYSSVAQVGYILGGLSLATPLGIIGGLFHLINHALSKSLLFLNAGAVEQATGTRDIDALGGLENRMKVTSTTSVVGSLTIAGIPPFSGFWSKLIIIIAAVQAENYWLAGAAILGSLLTLSMLLKVQSRVFLGKLKDTLKEVREVAVPMQAAMIILAVLCLTVGVWFYYFINTIIEPAAVVLLG